jgi:hypothetical protein
VDLYGVCADFFPALKPLVAEWLGRDLDDLPEDVSYGLPEWVLTNEEYARVDRWAVTERNLFGALPPIDGAGSCLQRAPSNLQ